MFLMNWLLAKKPAVGGKGAFTRARERFSQTTLPLISPRRGRRILRRDQLFSVIRESLIRAGVLSTSYEFKVITLDANGDSFLVLVDLALSGQSMPDEYLLEIERWIQQSAQSRHDMRVRSVYWRRKAAPEQVGMALRASVSAQTRRETVLMAPGMVPPRSKPAKPAAASVAGPLQPVGEDEVRAFRQALQSAPAPVYRTPAQARAEVPPEALSDFQALSETQHGKL